MKADTTEILVVRLPWNLRRYRQNEGIRFKKSERNPDRYLRKSEFKVHKRKNVKPEKASRIAFLAILQQGSATAAAILPRLGRVRKRERKADRFRYCLWKGYLQMKRKETGNSGLRSALHGNHSGAVAGRV